MPTGRGRWRGGGRGCIDASTRTLSSALSTGSSPGLPSPSRMREPRESRATGVAETEAAEQRRTAGRRTHLYAWPFSSRGEMSGLAGRVVFTRPAGYLTCGVPPVCSSDLLSPAGGQRFVRRHGGGGPTLPCRARCAPAGRLSAPRGQVRRGATQPGTGAIPFLSDAKSSLGDARRSLGDA